MPGIGGSPGPGRVQCPGARGGTVALGLGSGRAPRSSRTGHRVQRGDGCPRGHYCDTLGITKPVWSNAQGSGPRGSVAPTAAARGSWLWGGLRTACFGRGVMRFLSPRETAGEWSLVAELVKATSHAQSYCSPLVFSFADFCFYFRPAGGLMYPTACLFFLLIISVSLKKDITSLCKPCLHCSQQGR